LYKVNNEKYVDKIVKEVNANVLTGKRNVIFNMEHIKIFSDSYANLFSEVYKTISSKDGMFILIKPCDEVIKALEYVFLSDTIQIFDSVEEAVEYIEMNNFSF
jgi:anti-anti-sigma regulatory factor